MPPVIPLLLTVASIVGFQATLSAEPAAPEGFRALFNGKDLTGWYGWNPHSTVKLQGDKLSEALKTQRNDFTSHWRVDNEELLNVGTGPYACTENAEALKAVQFAREALGQRVARRIAQGVLGANATHTSETKA